MLDVLSVSGILVKLSGIEVKISSKVGWSYDGKSKAHKVR